MPYSKLDADLVHSTIWREPNPTRIVWITMLALKNGDGEVRASIPGLADVARVSVPECEIALKTFLSPDPYSRSKEHEGRRIEEIPGGWFVLNHDLYRHLDDDDDRRAKTAARVRRHRERQRGNGTEHPSSVTALQGVTSVTSNTMLREKRHTDTDTEADTETEKTKATTLGASPLVADFATAWSLYPKRTGGNSKADALKCWNARVRSGVNPAEMLAGVQRYAAFCEATGKIGTEFVKQARTFFGPAQHWTESWDIPPVQRRALSRTERGREALQRFLDRGQTDGDRTSGGGNAGTVPRALPQPRPD